MPNKTTKALKAMIEGALDRAGGEDYLLSCAKSDPRSFLVLVGKLIPSEMKAQLTGADGEPLRGTTVIGGVTPEQLQAAVKAALEKV